MGLHKNLVLSDIHSIVAFVYSNAAARATATGLTASDVRKVAHQIDDDSFWVLTDESPLTWSRLGGASASGVIARALADSNVTLSGLQTIDDVSLGAGDYVLLIGQADQSQNGVWVVASGSWTRAPELDSSGEVRNGVVVTVADEGSNYGATSWFLYTVTPYTPNGDNIFFSQFGGRKAAGEVPADIAASGVAGTSVRWAPSNHVHGIGANVVGNTHLRQGAARSVIGVSGNATANVADIVATTGTDGVLREQGGTIGFGQVATAGIANSAITYAKMQSASARTLLGRSANSGGAIAEIAGAGSGTFMRDSGTTIGFSAIQATDLPAASGSAQGAMAASDFTKLGNLNYGEKQISAVATDDPNNSNWTVNAIAPLQADASNAALVIAAFDDTTEQGRGFELAIPSGCTSLRFTFWCRPASAPAGTRTVGPKLYKRLIGASGGGSAVSSWDSTTLTDFSFGTNTNWVAFQRTVAFNAFTSAIVAGNLYQFEFTRVNPAGGTELTGNMNLKLIVVEFL